MKAARASGGEAAHTAAGGRGYSTWSRRLQSKMHSMLHMLIWALQTGRRRGSTSAWKGIPEQAVCRRTPAGDKVWPL